VALSLPQQTVKIANILPLALVMVVSSGFKKYGGASSLWYVFFISINPAVVVHLESSEGI
jgi:hypothetical protein